MKSNLKNDVIFKTFFSRKGNEAFLIDFLEALLEIKIETIKIEQEVNLGRFSPQEKTGSLDIQAILNDGIVVDIEMQVDDRHNIVARSVFYGAKPITRLTPKGEEYENIKKIIMINILNDELFLFENYITKMVTVMDEKVNQWLAIIDDVDKELIEMAEEKNQLLRKVRAEFVELSGDEETRRLEELKDKWVRDYKSGVSYARQEGLEQGLEQGEKNKSIEIAKEMLNNDIDTEMIIKCTKLAREEIENLKKAQKNL